MINYCPNCGERVTTPFCPNCGYNVGQLYTTPSQPAPKQNSENLTEKLWFIILMLLLVWPVGLVFMWMSNQFSKNAKIAITVAITVLVVLYIILVVASELLFFLMDSTYYY